MYAPPIRAAHPPAIGPRTSLARPGLRPRSNSHHHFPFPASFPLPPLACILGAAELAGPETMPLTPFPLTCVGLPPRSAQGTHPLLQAPGPAPLVHVPLRVHKFALSVELVLRESARVRRPAANGAMPLALAFIQHPVTV